MTHVRGSELWCFNSLLVGGPSVFCRTSCNPELDFYFLRPRQFSTRTRCKFRKRRRCSRSTDYVSCAHSIYLCLQTYLSPNTFILPPLMYEMPLCAYPALLPRGLHNILLTTDISDGLGTWYPWSIFSPFWGLVTNQLLFLNWRIIICRITNKSSQSAGLSEKVRAICEDNHGQALKWGSIERALRICASV